MADAPDDLGGLGELARREGTKVADVGLIRRAVAERWEIDAPRRRRLVAILSQIAETDEVEVEAFRGAGENAVGTIKVCNHRNQIAAVRTLAAMVGQNQADEHLEAKIAADAKNPKGTDVRILVVDARGSERPLTGLRELYLGASPALPASTPDPGRPQQEQGDDGGSARR
jgi:hypothetical protein